LSRVFGDDVDSDLISDLVHEASKATHGATLVISERAEAEAERLSGSATLVVPEKLSQLRLRRSSRMDGATLVDPSGTCHAIGVILDGEAQRDGDPSRGARYNSSNRYVKSAAHAVLAVIVSEDGGATIVPTPRKRIRRQRVLDALAVLEESMTREERGAFGSAFDELSEMMFYLSDAECARVNELAKMVQDAAMEVGGITIVRPTLIANPEMNESFFIP
jgi:predicted phage gp36 major capsid-like protein